MADLGRNLSGGTPTWFTEICCEITYEYALPKLTFICVICLGFAQVNSSQADDPLAVVGWSQQYDPTMVGALRMANLIYQSFTYAEDEHWYDPPIE
jgi:hypothetical protein